jgi:leader peptidase (prepilin peptidase)/N-methyltransferase
MTFAQMGTGLSIYFLVLAAMLGAVCGSAFTCMGDRLSEHVSWIHGRSHCDACGHVLKARDLIPVFSYLFSKGKCRYCGTKLSPKYLVTEILMALVFVLTIVHYGGLDVLMVRDWGLACALLALAIVDLNTYEIPDGFHLFLIGWWIVFTLIEGSGKGNLGELFVQGLLGGAVIAGFVLIISLIMDRVLKKESMGGGDIKLLFGTGLYLGVPGGLLSLITACIAGLLFVLTLKRNRIPFGPSISLACILTILFGSGIINWYLGLF